MTTQHVRLTVNGEVREADVEPRLLLVHLLRDVFLLTGTHIGCDTSNCGACTIHVNGQSAKSCTMLAVQADGAEIRTIEGMADGATLHALQQAFWDQHGLQCGFCTPGMIMSAAQLLERYPKPTEEQIRHQLDGNLCRCTGYRAILTCVDTTQLGPEFAGREFDVSFLEDLPAEVDPCGERGEFHTCVYAGPHFAGPLPLIAGERVRRDARFQYCDVQLAPATTAAA